MAIWSGAGMTSCITGQHQRSGVFGRGKLLSLVDLGGVSQLDRVCTDLCGRVYQL